VSERPVPKLDASAVETALAGLRGRIVQKPPAYSALKQDGEPLYRKARRGETVEAKPREIDVHRFDLIEIQPTALRLHVECGSGTYVRSLVRDLGEHLGCGAHVTVLRRLWVEPFMAPRMHRLEELEAIANEGGFEALDTLLEPLEVGLAGYPKIKVDEAAALRLRQGQPVDGYASTRMGSYVAIDPGGQAVALVECGGDGRLRTQRGFNRLP